MIDIKQDSGSGLFEGERSGRMEARLLINSVEGTQAPMAYGLAGGRPVMKAGGVELGAPVDRQLLIDFLRSNRPISRDVRNWLADMLDPAVSTNANLTLSSRAGNRKSNMLEYLDAVEAYLDRGSLGDGYDAAIADVAPRFRMTKSLLRKAVARLADGLKVHQDAQRNR